LLGLNDHQPADGKRRVGLTMQAYGGVTGRGLMGKQTRGIRLRHDGQKLKPGRADNTPQGRASRQPAPQQLVLPRPDPQAEIGAVTTNLVCRSSRSCTARATAAIPSSKATRVREP